MKVSPHGYGYSTKESSFRPIIVDDFRKKILEAIKRNNEIKPEVVDEQEIRQLRQVDAARPDNPEEAGWTFLINKKNSFGEKIIQAIKPLATLRKMDDSESPLLFNDTQKQFWGKWIREYKQLRKGQFKIPPKYILIIGGPDSIPFAFQAKLSTAAYVGRLDFDNITEIQEYANKVKTIEEGDTSPVSKEVTFFATDHGVNSTGCYDPTHFSRYDIEKELEPTVDVLHEQFENVHKFKTNKLIEESATKKDLIKNIHEVKPSLFFSSSWGMCAPGEELNLQKKFNGAICCQGDPKNVSYNDLLFTEVDIPSESFLEGGVFFQHSSFGYGTPATSDLQKWISNAEKWGMPKQIAQTDFTASLPKKLVFHKKGPIAFIGHLDEMLSYTFAPDEDFQMEDRKQRLDPISRAIEHMLLGRPVGYSLGNMKERLSDLNGDLADLNDELSIEGKSSREKEYKKLQLKLLSDKFLERHESKNYLIFGDPAVRIKL